MEDNDFLNLLPCDGEAVLIHDRGGDFDWAAGPYGNHAMEGGNSSIVRPRDGDAPHDGLVWGRGLPL